MSATSEIISARLELYARAVPTRTSLDYVRDNGLDTDEIATAAGCFTIMQVAILPGSRWDFVEASGGDDIIVAAVIEVFGRDGETVVDLLAWPIDDPSRILTMFGRADALGLVNLYSATSYIFGQPLVIHRTPLQWWQAGCRGAVVLSRSAARHLQDAPGRIAGVDRQHSRELAGMVRSLFDPSKFVTPAATVVREAA